MGVECLIVVAHAMGRTLVVPPPQHLYLLGRTHKQDGKKPKDEMGFEDFYDMDLLRSHKVSSSSRICLSSLLSSPLITPLLSSSFFVTHISKHPTLSVTFAPPTF
jgi:hypothetical protein